MPPSLFVFNLSQHQGLFQWVGSSHQVTKGLELRFQHQSFQWIFRVDFLEYWLISSPSCSRDSQESSPTLQFKNINSSTLSLLCGPPLTSIHGYWENHSFDYMTIWTLSAKWCLCFNTLSKFFIAFSEEQASFNFVVSVTIPIDFGAQENEIAYHFHIFSICHEVIQPDVMIILLNVEF